MPLLPLSEHILYNDAQYGAALHTLRSRSFRKVERDGNCLYLSFAMLVYPFLSAPAARESFLGTTPLFEEAGASAVAYETFIEIISDFLDAGKHIDAVSDEEWIQIIGYLRMAASAYLLMHKEDYESFLSETTIEHYTKQHVDPMGERAGEIEIIALSSLFRYEVHIVQTGTDGRCTTISYGKGDQIMILHTPDHFEPLY